MTLSYKQITDLVGKHIPDEVVDSILKSLEIEITDCTDRVMQLQVPTYRVDVQRPCDVIEDVLRIYGYNNVEMPSEVHSSLSFKTPTSAADDMRRKIANQLTGEGFNEILNNSLTAEKYYTPWLHTLQKIVCACSTPEPGPQCDAPVADIRRSRDYFTQRQPQDARPGPL